MGRIRFKFKKPDPKLNLGEGYAGFYEDYGFVLHLADLDKMWRVVWNYRGGSVVRHNGAYKSLEEAGTACEELLEKLLSKN